MFLQSSSLCYSYACKIDGRMDPELHTHIISDEFFRTLEYYGLGASTIIFSKTVIRHTPPALPANGLRTMESKCWSGLHSPQTSIPSSIYGSS